LLTLLLSSDVVYFTIKKNFSFFLGFSLNKTRFRNGFLVIVVTTSCSTELVLMILLFIFAILGLAIWFAVKNELVPSVILFKNINNIFVMEILCR